MFNVTGLFNYFTSPINEPFQSYSGYQSGYESSNTFALLQKSIRVKTISQNSIFDYIQTENDPNFNRSSGHLNNLFSKLSVATSLTTMIHSKLFMAGVTEFIPANINQLISNLQGITDTGINLSSVLQNGNIFKQVETAFVNDLELQLGSGTLTFSQVKQIYDTISNTQLLKEEIENTGLRPLLSLGLQNFLPNSMIDVFESLQWLDNLNTIFENDPINANKFNNQLIAGVQNYGTNTVDDLIPPAQFTDLKLGLADPMGTVARDNFQSQLIAGYKNELVTQLTAACATYGVSTPNLASCLEILNDDADDNITKAFTGKIGLPSLNECVNGVNVDVYNNTVLYTQSAFTKLANNIIIKLGINSAPAGVRPMDYLINVKTNIEKRIEMKRRGDTTDAFTEIERFLKDAFPNQDFDESKLEALNLYIQNVLNEREGVTIG